jgi:hypothetical protein
MRSPFCTSKSVKIDTCKDDSCAKDSNGQSTVGGKGVSWALTLARKGQVFVQIESDLTPLEGIGWIPMERDKSPETSSATSTFSRASSQSERFTRAGASKALDFTLASGLKAPKQNRRRVKTIQAEQIQDLFSNNLDNMALPHNNLDEQISHHMYNFGNDKVTGRPRVPPLIPMC